MKKNRFKIDTYKEGGNKSEWISNKISEIMKEGKYPQEQAIAIAYNMYDNMHQNGGEKTSKLKNIYDIKQGVYNPSMGQGVQLFYRDPSDPKFNPETDLEFVKSESLPTVQESQVYKDYLNRKSTNTPFTPTDLFGDYEIPKFLPQKEIANIRPNVRTEGKRQGLPEGTYTKVYYKDNTVDYLDDKGLSLSRQMPNFQTYYKSKQFQTGGWYENNPPMFTTAFAEKENKEPFVVENTIQEENIQPYQQPPQFFNPYGGVDLATGAQTFGRGLESGNALDIVSGGLKTLAGTARNIFAGMGQENVRQESLKNYYDNQRDMLTKTSYQDGGEVEQEQLMQQVAQALQNGSDPQEVLQQLMQMGIPQDQAVQIIQSLMEQMQGQTQQEQPIMRDGGYFLNQMKGKKIKDYKFNPDTNSYDVEFE